MNGIRLYYGNGNQDETTTSSIQELQWTFGQTNTTWAQGNTFSDSDGTTGVACSIYDGSVDSESDQNYLNVYLRNSTTSQVAQTYWDFSSPDLGWAIGENWLPCPLLQRSE